MRARGPRSRVRRAAGSGQAARAMGSSRGAGRGEGKADAQAWAVTVGRRCASACGSCWAGTAGLALLGWP